MQKYLAIVYYLEDTDNLPESYIDHLKSALFILQKCLQQKQYDFDQIYVSKPEEFLARIIKLL